MDLVTIYTICDFFKTDPNLVKRGQTALKSEHMLEVDYGGDGRARGVIYASYEKQKYEVEVEISNQKITRIKCGCPNGRLQCHHMAAVLLWLEKNVSRTDIECQWRKAKKTIDSADKRASQIWPSRALATVERGVDENDIKYFVEGLANLNRPTGFGWLLSEEPVSAPYLQTPEEIIKSLESQDYSSENDKQTAILNGLQLTEDIRNIIQNQTKGQRNNSVWHRMRQGRITASNFGKILRAIKRGRYPPSLMKTLAGQYNSAVNASSIQWGIVHESMAISWYSNFIKRDITPCGLFVDESGMLGASPDGIINDEELVEIKCPFSAKDCTFREVIAKNKDFFLTLLDDKITLRPSHEYYDQIQGALYLASANICHFVAWTPKEYFVQKIVKDPRWAANITQLQQFYKAVFLPYFISIAKQPVAIQ